MTFLDLRRRVGRYVQTNVAQCGHRSAILTGEADHLDAALARCLDATHDVGRVA